MTKGQRQLRTAEDMGIRLPDLAKVLDFGCGAGNTVNDLLKHGYDCYGCDFQFKDGPHVARLVETNRLQIIQPMPYRLPFDNNTFHCILSNNVFEHVKNFDQTLTELSRVLCEGGACLNIFPSRYLLLEPHVKVPMATIFQSYYWLRLWSALGIKTTKQKQAKLKAREIAEKNYRYLKDNTNYLTKRELYAVTQRYFREVKFVELASLKYCRWSGLHPLVKRFPLAQEMISTFGVRSLLLVK